LRKNVKSALTSRKIYDLVLSFPHLFLPNPRRAKEKRKKMVRKTKGLPRFFGYFPC